MQADFSWPSSHLKQISKFGYHQYKRLLKFSIPENRFFQREPTTFYYFRKILNIFLFVFIKWSLIEFEFVKQKNKILSIWEIQLEV